MRYRVELGLIWILFSLLEVGLMAPWFVYVPVWIALVTLVAHPRTSRWIFGTTSRMLRKAKVRRKLERAAEDCELNLHIGKIAETVPGELVDVYVARGQTVDKLDRQARALAACLKVSDVRVAHDRENRSHGQISIIRRDPFTVMGALPWPLLDAESVDIRHGIPFGADEYGREYVARLLSRNIILGGAPDSGKSTALRVFAAAAALDPRAKLWMMDAKPGAVEFSAWKMSATELVEGRNLDHAVQVFQQLEARVEERYKAMTQRGLDFVADDMEIDVLMIDELPQFTRSFETDSREQAAAVKKIRGGIWKLIAMGRAAGMISILSAQKPTADIVPSESRDLIDHKFALHCNTRPMSDAILGAGAGEEAPANAAEIPSGQPGVGYYVGDGGVIKLRAYLITRSQALSIAARASARNLDEELAAL